MTRIILGIVVAIMLSACTSDTGSAANDAADPDAQAAKEEMDTEAEAVLPDLSAELGGKMSGLQAHFSERGGFGIWDYFADGHITDPPGTMTGVLDLAETVLTKRGYTVTRDESQKRVSGKKGNVSLTVEASLLSDVRVVSSLNVHLGVSGISEGDDFAENAPAEDYLAYLK